MTPSEKRECTLLHNTETSTWIGAGDTGMGHDARRLFWSNEFCHLHYRLHRLQATVTGQSLLGLVRIQPLKFLSGWTKVEGSSPSPPLGAVILK
jgi:hypothetical protein